eukprot:TRINITY_DN4196_c0_g3_i1.p1 TRINITY_DN4196_c0_g3~~TRINITY_DN4196_c0_g3_i1.p1  ORF type:complete len:711 (-),score=102.69 TRINITY_DN4196_c0_g3_i1:63-2195(-)
MIPYVVIDGVEYLQEFFSPSGIENFVSYSIKQLFKFHYLSIPSSLCRDVLSLNIDISVIRLFFERRIEDDPNFDPMYELFRNRRYHNGKEKLELLLELGFNPITGNNYPLRVCLSREYFDEFYRLLELDIQLEYSVEDPTVRNIDLITERYAESILGVVLQNNYPIQLLETLVNRGVDLNAPVNTNMYYPLHFIASQHNKDFIPRKEQLNTIIHALKEQGLLEEQINMDIPRIGTPLIQCVIGAKMDLSDRETARLLIQEGADINFICKNHLTGLMSTSYYEGNKLIRINVPSLCIPKKWLWDDLVFSSDIILRIPIVPHDHLYTPLLISIIEQLDTRIEFIKNSKNLLFQDHNGATALHHAVLQQDIESVIILKEKEPELIYVKDVYGKTALDIAFGYGLNSIQSILEPISQVSTIKPFKMTLDVTVALHHIYLFMNSKKDILSCSQVCRNWRLSMTDEFWRDFICSRQFTIFPDILLYRNALDRYYKYSYSLKHQDDKLKWMDLPKWLFICEEFECLSLLYNEQSTQVLKCGINEKTGFLKQERIQLDIVQPALILIAQKVYRKLLSFYPILINYPFKDNKSYERPYQPGYPRIYFSDPLGNLNIYLVDQEYIDLFHNPFLVKQLGHKNFYHSKPTHITFDTSAGDSMTYQCLIDEFMDSVRPSRNLAQLISCFLFNSTFGPTKVPSMEEHFKTTTSKRNQLFTWFLD